MPSSTNFNSGRANGNCNLFIHQVQSDGSTPTRSGCGKSCIICSETRSNLRMSVLCDWMCAVKDQWSDSKWPIPDAEYRKAKLKACFDHSTRLPTTIEPVPASDSDLNLAFG